MIKKESVNYKIIINIIIVLNLIDLILTFIGLEAGYFIEANVMMENLYNFSKIGFILIKSIAILFFGFICYKFYDKITLRVKRLLFIPLIAYIYITILHCLVLYFVFK